MMGMTHDTHAATSHHRSFCHRTGGALDEHSTTQERRHSFRGRNAPLPSSREPSPRTQRVKQRDVQRSESGPLPRRSELSDGPSASPFWSRSGTFSNNALPSLSSTRAYTGEASSSSAARPSVAGSARAASSPLALHRSVAGLLLHCVCGRPLWASSSGRASALLW